MVVQVHVMLNFDLYIFSPYLFDNAKKNRYMHRKYLAENIDFIKFYTTFLYSIFQM